MILLAIPAEIANGYRIRVTQLDVTGEAFGDSQASARFDLEVFQAGARGKALPVRPTIGAGPFLERETMDYATGCGQAFNFRMNSSAVVQALASAQDVGMRISSIKLYFKVEKCK